MLGLLAMPGAQAASATLDFPVAKRPSPDAYPELRATFPEGVTGLPSVVYARKAGYRPLTLDLYLPRHPEGAAPLPLVVHIHGGAWVSGTPRENGAFANFPAVLAALAARGYVVASVQYRLDGEARFPAAIEDVQDSIRFLRVHAVRYGLDAKRVAVWGGSAGGQLAALAAVACGTNAFRSDAVPNFVGSDAPGAGPPPDACVQCGVAWYPVTDFQTIPIPPNTTGPQPYLGCASFRCPKEKLAYASPASYVDHDDPPILLVHGDRDRLVATSQSIEFQGRLKAAGVHSRLLLIPGADHGFVAGTLGATKAASLQALEATFDFFDAVLKTTRLDSNSE